MFSHSLVVITHQVRPLSQTLDNKLVALCPTIDVLDIIGRGLEMAGRIVAFGDEDVIVHTTFKWLIQRNWRTLKLSADLGRRQTGQKLTMNFSSILPRRSKPGANSRW